MAERGNMEKIKLNDGSTLDITQASTSGVTVAGTLAGFESTVEKFTKENLASFQITQADGTVLSTMNHYKPTGKVTVLTRADGIESTIEIIAMSDLEVRMDALEATQDVIIAGELK